MPRLYKEKPSLCEEGHFKVGDIVRVINRGIAQYRVGDYCRILYIEGIYFRLERFNDGREQWYRKQHALEGGLEVMDR